MARRSRSSTVRGDTWLATFLARWQLTVSGAAVLALAVVCWLLARRIGSRSLFLLVYLAVLATFVSWLVTRRRPAMAVDRSSLSRRMREGQTANMVLTVQANRRVTGVIVHERLPAELGGTVRIPIASLRPGTDVDHRYTFTPVRRGVYNVGPTTVVWSDPFGLTVHEEQLAEPVEVIVHPATEPVHDRVLTRMWEDPPIRPPVSKPWPTGFEFYGMREYVPGDDLRRVVWSAVAKTDRMLVRESEQGITDRISIFLDTHREWHSTGDPSDTFETGVKAAASLGVHHLADGYSVSLLSNDRRLATSLRGTQAAKMAFLACGVPKSWLSATSWTAGALPMTRRRPFASRKTLVWPGLSRPWKRSRPAKFSTCSQVRPLLTRTRAVATLFGTTATADGGVDGRLDAGGGEEGVVAGGVSLCAVGWLGDLWTRPYAASKQIATRAAAMAAVQFGGCRSARAARSGSAGWLGTGTCIGSSTWCVRSNSATSGSGSTPMARAMLRRWPRA